MRPVHLGRDIPLLFVCFSGGVTVDHLLDVFAPEIVALICVVTALAAVIVGSLVQKCTKMAIPKDFVTIIIILFILADLFIMPIAEGLTQRTLWYPKLDILLYMAFIFGYWVGYYINGKRSWIMVCTLYPAPGEFPEQYRVLYINRHGKACIADQNNRALFKRWFFDIHHTIDLPNAKSIKDKVIRTTSKHPILRFRYKRLWCNHIDELPVQHKKAWIFNLKVYTTKYDLADVHQAEQWEVVRSFERLDTLNEEIRLLNQENMELRTQIETGITRTSVELMQDIHQGDPITQYLNEKERRKKDAAAQEELKRKEAEAKEEQKKRDQELKENERKEQHS